MKTFQDKVIAIVKKIPRGNAIAYKEVARRAGNPSASRAVGNIMAKNSDKKVPCHRVIRSDGGMGGYNRINGSSKLALLKKEGYLK